jgi:ATP-dependent exoDNAse (exonuclease V) beta subunit
LRTLYVACTRSQDYLVLSASLTDSFAPETAWMLTLAERFDLRSGACVAEDVPAGERPRVRVTEGTDTSLSREARLIGSRNDESALSEVARPSGESAVEPVPARLSGKRLFTVTEVEHWLGRPRGRGRPALRPEDVAPQYDAEDGSDRREWRPPGDRLWTVLDRWDFRDAEGWRVPLDDVLEAATNPDLREALEAMLSRFADSEARVELGRARRCLRDVEFLLDVPEEGVTLRGLIDCLWEDEDGRRHLLAFAAGNSPRKRRRAKSANWPLAPVLAAVALQRQSGAWPETVTAYDLATGDVLRGDGGRLPHAEALAAVAAAVTELCRETLPA